MKKLVSITIIAMALSAVSLWAEDAKANYEKECAKCHGPDGAGKTKMGEKLGIKDYSSAKVQGEMKDDEMAKAIKEGVKDKAGKTRMKGFGETLNDQDIKALVTYIRSLKK